MKSQSTNRSTQIVVAAVLCFFGGARLAAALLADSHQTDARKKVAAGEYEIVRPAQGREGIGPFSAAVYDFRESFTLWRLPDGGFEAEGRRSYESPKGEAHDNRFSARLSAEMRATGVTDFRTLRFRPNSGPLACEFHPQQFLCTSGKGAEDPKLDLAMKFNYGLFWPASAFSLGRIAIGANRETGQVMPVQLVTIDEPNRANPVAASVLDGSLKFIHRKTIHLAGVDWDADEFELAIPMEPPYLLWVANDGLILLFGPEGDSISGPETGLQLARYATFN